MIWCNCLKGAYVGKTIEIAKLVRAYDNLGEGGGYKQRETRLSAKPVYIHIIVNLYCPTSI